MLTLNVPQKRAEPVVTTLSDDWARFAAATAPVRSMLRRAVKRTRLIQERLAVLWHTVQTL